MTLFILVIVVTVIIIPAIVVYSIRPAGPTGSQLTRVHKGEDIPIRVYMHEQDKIMTMTLEEYTIGVVAAEMPAEFDGEALKAQAVAARTYAVKQMGFFGGSGLANRPGADVSTDYRDNQAWISEGQAKQKWGQPKATMYWKKITQAVDDTRGLILTYNGDPVNAVFHSTSGERTASAREVWGYDYPYLQSVACRWDQRAPRYSDTRQWALADMEKRLGTDAGVMAAVKSGISSVAQIMSRTDSGRVDTIRIGSKTFTGLAVREKLELRSSNFTVEQKEETIIFKTTGYGHGVGMCQYGAHGMALEGHDFRHILTYYYQGVAIKNIHGS